jgi:hypothetical protein
LEGLGGKGYEITETNHPCMVDRNRWAKIKTALMAIAWRKCGGPVGGPEIGDTD